METSEYMDLDLESLEIKDYLITTERIIRELEDKIEIYKENNSKAQERIRYMIANLSRLARHNEEYCENKRIYFELNAVKSEYQCNQEKLSGLKSTFENLKNVSRRNKRNLPAVDLIRSKRLKRILL
jgi:hypothetical protein